MNGPIAQLVALAFHGNGFLSGILSTDFLTHNSTAQFCESVRFVRFEKSWFGTGKQSEVLVADSPDTWFAYLRKKKAEQLLVRWQATKDPKAPDRRLAGFIGGGGSWILVIRFANGQFELWQARWEVGDQKRKDRKIWRVTYGCVSSGKVPPPPTISLVSASAELKNALLEILQFSIRKKCDGYMQCFERALKSLAGEKDSEAFHRDLFPGNIAPAVVAI